jgi:threonine aldolase
MRKAMAEAEVGDDVFGEDPTVRELEERAAEAFGQDAGLFMPSGTMANQVAIAVHCRPGDDVVVEARGHTMSYELGAMSALSGACPRPVEAPRGLLTPTHVEAALFPDAYYLPRARLVILENSHAMAGGTVHALTAFASTVATARRRGLAVHLDGARVWNAALAAGCRPLDYGRQVDSGMFCLSKGLGAPVGSVLCGSAAFVAEARRVRKRFGGGMRQVGVLAAAGLVALETGPALLAEDHRRARVLAEALADLPGAELDLDAVETNIVIAHTRQRPAAAVVADLESRGVRAVPAAPHAVRFVTHRDVDDAQIDRALAALREVFGPRA